MCDINEYACVASDELIGRFRPNLVVETREAFEEETWSSVKIGSHTFTVCALLILFTYLLSY